MAELLVTGISLLCQSEKTSKYMKQWILDYEQQTANNFDLERSG